ncbi:MAG: aldo/keto reductase [Promethearchaeota archaeon]
MIWNFLYLLYLNYANNNNGIGKKRGISKQQVALSWLVSHDRIQAIPKSITPSHIKDNASVGEITLMDEEINVINRAIGKL